MHCLFQEQWLKLERIASFKVVVIIDITRVSIKLFMFREGLKIIIRSAITKNLKWTFFYNFLEYKCDNYASVAYLFLEF